MLNDFQANRRLVAEYSAQPNTAAGTASVAGVGFYQTPVSSSDIVAAIGGEQVMKFSVAAAGNSGLSNAAPTRLAMSPAKNPRMLVRGVLPAASANVSWWLCGFVSNWTSASTPNGAYLRIVTTGNVFFVTRQGGSETATDLGALARTSTVLGFEIETADAGVTWTCKNQAGTVLATSTTNVPTAATDLAYGIYAVTGTGAVPWGVAYARIEGTFA